MSEPTPTLDAYIQVANRLAEAWLRTLGKIYDETQTAVENFSRVCIYLNDQGYTYELMFPEGNEEWDIFV